jgi:hypothetical protein
LALAKTISAVAITKGAAAGGSTMALVKGALKIMAWTKAKTAVVAAAAVILAAGTTTPIVVHHYRANSSIFSSTTELTGSDNVRFVGLTGTTPTQVAKTFFDACGQEDWTEAVKYWPTDPRVKNAVPAIPDELKKIYGGLAIVSLGKPFKGKISITSLPAEERKRLQAQGVGSGFEYPGVYVPYEIRLKDGTVKKWQLAIRCDNPEHRWYFDGGM